MDKKLTSKLIHTTDDYATFWDQNGSKYHADLRVIADNLGTGLHYDVYSDGFDIRLDGSLKPGEQRIIQHDFTKEEASPAFWQQR